MVYNLTGVIENSTGIVEFIQSTNQHLMLGWFGTMMLLGIASILFMSFMFRTNDVGQSFSATAFISFGLAIMLRALDLVSNLVLFVTLITAAAAIAFTWKRD